MATLSVHFETLCPVLLRSALCQVLIHINTERLSCVIIQYRIWTSVKKREEIDMSLKGSEAVLRPMENLDGSLHYQKSLQVVGVFSVASVGNWWRRNRSFRSLQCFFWKIIRNIPSTVSWFCRYKKTEEQNPRSLQILFSFSQFFFLVEEKKNYWQKESWTSHFVCLFVELTFSTCSWWNREVCMNFLLERSKLEESEISCLSDTIDRREREKVKDFKHGL